MNNYHPLETDRLILRRLRPEDTAALFAYRNDPEVARYQGWGQTYSEEQSRALIERQQELQPGTPGEWFQFAIEVKVTGALAGDCAIKTNSGLWDAELGCTLAIAYQRQGIAAEATRRVIDFAFDELGIHRVFAIADCRNTAAVATLERLRLRREAHFMESFKVADGWADEYLYAILDREWRAYMREAAHKELSADFARERMTTSKRSG